MAKAKVVTALALTVVMLVVMTGLAVADPANVDITANPIINPLDGTTVTNTTTVTYNIDYSTHGDSHTRYISVQTSKSNLYARVTGNGVDTGWTNNARVGGTYTAISPNNYTFTLSVKGTEEGQVTVYDNAGSSFNSSAGYDFASCTRNVEVPEFATIAIPVAAILGLLFFYNHRKRKEE